MFTVYALRDPRDGAIRYVGCTVHALPHRLGAHLSAARCGAATRRTTGRVKPWLRELLAAGIRPDIATLQRVGTLQRANRAEVRWIKRLREAGEPLTNVRDIGMSCHQFSHTAALRVPRRGGRPEPR